MYNMIKYSLIPIGLIILFEISKNKPYQTDLDHKKLKSLR